MKNLKDFKKFIRQININVKSYKQFYHLKIK